MSRDILVAIVGKPSAGKSTFLNAISDATAKVGGYPFTTIEPNRGVAFVHIKCPCERFGRQSDCRPRHGKCQNGQRYVPLQILDVAGLVPGASKGEGLGNQFLNDLTQAHCLIHVVDVSGTTDERGKETVGFDPINDIDWLHSELHSWIYNNLLSKWDQIKRRHVATNAPIIDTLQAQLGGYGCTRATLNLVLTHFNNPDRLETWSEATVHEFVSSFLTTRFPTIYALNKIDLPDSDRNIDRISRKYEADRIVLTSAISELFLRKLESSGYITYQEATDQFLTSQDDASLKEMDDRMKGRLERVQDLILFRYGNTGVQEVLQTVVRVLGLIPVFPVHNVNNFGAGGGAGVGARVNGIFRDCFWVRPGTTMRQVAHMVSPELDKFYAYAETVGNVRLAEEDFVTLENNIISFKTTNKD